MLVVRKLGLPWAPEVAFGAIGPYGVSVRDERSSEPAQSDRSGPGRLARHERGAETGGVYRHGRPPLDLTGKVAMLVDDGLATGATARAAVALAREMRAAKIVVIAARSAAPEAVRPISAAADEVVCPIVPQRFDSVSQPYDGFGQVADDEVMALLAARRLMIFRGVRDA